MNKDKRSTIFGLAFVAVSISALVAELILGPPHSTQIIMIVALMLLLGITTLLYFVRKDCNLYKSAIILIIGSGIIMRIGYCFYTDMFVREHDFGSLEFENWGHATYLMYVIVKGQLPPSSYGQFYQQPLFYFLSAIVSKPINFILGRDDLYSLVNMSRIVTCSASIFIIFVSDLIAKEIKLSDKGRMFALIPVSFIPAFFLSGGAVGVDSLTALFMSLQILFTIKWYRKPTWKNTIILAFLFGLGVLTKISCAVIAIPTAFLFLRKAFSFHDNPKVQTKLFLRIVCFGLIALPLGLWYTVRGYLLFGPGATNVPRTFDYYSPSTEGYSLLERFGPIDIKSLCSSPCLVQANERNVNTALIKSSLFGHDPIEAPLWMEYFLLILGLMLILVVISSLIWLFINNRREKAYLYLGFVTIFYYMFIVAFCYKYPAVCSMDYRYMLICAVPSGLILGRMLERVKKGFVSEVISILLTLYPLLACLIYLVIQ